MTPLDGPSRLRLIQGPTYMWDNYRIVKAMSTLSHECTLTDQNTLPTNSADFSQEIPVVCRRQRQQTPPRATRTTLNVGREIANVEPMARECA